MDNKAIFFFGSSANIGLTTHFATQIVDMYQYGMKEGWHVYLLSIVQEQNEGLWRRVEEHIPKEFIIKYDQNSIHELNEKLLKKSLKYDRIVIHVQGISQLLSIKPLLLKSSITKVVTTIHAFANGVPYKRPIVSFIYTLLINKYVDKAIFLSPFAMRSFCGISYLLKKGKVAHIPFSLRSELEVKKSENVFFDLDKFNIIYLANFTKNKRHEHFLDPIIRFCHENPNVRVYFFGEGKQREKVIRKVNLAKCEKQIYCPGRISYDSVKTVLNFADLALNLSASETAGHAILEPVLHCIPLIATRVGFAEYLLQDYITGYGIDSPYDLYCKLQYVFTHYDKAKSLARETKKIAMPLFDYRRMIQAYFELYNNL